MHGAKEVQAWLEAQGYPSIDAWAADSDYRPTGWADEDGNPVDLMEQAFAAMEAEQAATATTHTPGPWEAEASMDGIAYVNGPRGKCVAGVYADKGDGTGDDFDVQEANARLIAAAPDLLAACEEALVLLRQDASASAHAVVCQLAAAIDRTGGE